MKKFLLVLTSILLLLLLLLIFTGCSSNTAEDASSAESTVASEASEVAASNSSKDDIDTSDLADIGYEELKKIYLECYSKKSDDEKFITDSEAEFYEGNGFCVRNDTKGYLTEYDSFFNKISYYYYPILISDDKMGYITELGELMLYSFNEKGAVALASAHYEDSSERERVIEATESYAVVWDDNSQLQLWKFGEKISELDLPEGAVYAGKSFWCGYIFRVNSDVYAVEIGEEGELTSTPIAHDVKQVICADYKLDSDAWSQPLFQMQDGSIKAYCKWNSQQDEQKEDDDKSFLHDINEDWYQK